MVLLTIHHHLNYRPITLQVKQSKVNGVGWYLFLCSCTGTPLTSVYFTCNLLGLYIRWWYMVICLKRPSKNSLIHLHNRCVSVPMILSFLCRSNDAFFTSVNLPYSLCHLKRWCVLGTKTNKKKLEFEQLCLIWEVSLISDSPWSLILCFFIHFWLDWLVIQSFT